MYQIEGRKEELRMKHTARYKKLLANKRRRDNRDLARLLKGLRVWVRVQEILSRQ